MVKRKMSETPSRIYKYGCLAPIEGAELFEQQLRRASWFYNDLVGIERSRSAAIQAIQREVCPRLAEIDMEIKEADKEKRKDLYAEAKQLKSKHAVTLKLRYTEVNERLKALDSYAWGRNRYGLWYDTVNSVKDRVAHAVKAARKTSPFLPQFKCYEGEGAIHQQIKNGGMQVGELFSPDNTMVRIVPLPPGVWNLPRNQRRKATRTTVSLRVGSVTRRQGIWVTFPVIIHRPLPEDAVVKRVSVGRSRVGVRFEYFLYITCESETFRPKKNENSGVVSIDLGWRKTDTGRRVAYLVDSQGNDREFILPDDFFLRLSKADDLRSIRGKNLEEIKKSIPGSSKWRSAKKVSLYAKKTGDVSVVEWLKHDRHLCDWESHQRNRCLNYRREQYRLLAFDLAHQYKTIVIEDFKGSELLEKNERSQNRKMNMVAPGELQEIIIDMAAKYGVEVRKVSPAYSSRACHVCGDCCEWEDAGEQVHRCSKCGSTWDRDYNACRNLLAWARRPDGSKVLENALVNVEKQAA